MKLLTKNIWAEARKKKGTGKTTAVVAYVTADPLTLGHGDILICDASDRTVSQAATSAKVLKQMHSAGVVLFHLPGLHAKLVRMPSQVLIGSSNMTLNTSRLHEVAIISSDDVVIAQVDRYIAEIRGCKGLKRITATELRRLVAIPVVHSGIPNDLDPDTNRESRLWITRTNPISDKFAEKVRVELGSQINDGAHYEGGFVIFGDKERFAKRVQLGDSIVTIDKDEKVYGPHEVTGLHRRMGGRKRIQPIIVTFDVQSGRGKSWGKVQTILKETGAWARSGRPGLMTLEENARERLESYLSVKTNR